MKSITGNIHNAMYKHLLAKGFVAPVDILMEIGVLSKKDHDDWCFGRIPYLEKVCRMNLHKLSAVMHEVRGYAAKNNLKPSQTVYHQFGKNRHIRLQFSKSGNAQIEAGYSTHYVDTERICQIKVTRQAAESVTTSEVREIE